MRDEERRRDPAYKFLYLEFPLVNGVEFTSSNVAWVQYDIETNVLFIEYRSGHATDGRVYRYHPVSEDLARAAYNAMSKGTFVWDSLRIRGTMLGHQLNYSLVAGSQLPKWTQTSARQRQHNIQVGEQSGSGGPHPALQLGEMYGAPAPILPPYRAIGRFTL